MTPTTQTGVGWSAAGGMSSSSSYKNIPTQKYQADGTGRDLFIIMNNGGQTRNFKESYYHFFDKGLRGYEKEGKWFSSSQRNSVKTSPRPGGSISPNTQMTERYRQFLKQEKQKQKNMNQRLSIPKKLQIQEQKVGTLGTYQKQRDDVMFKSSNFERKQRRSIVIESDKDHGVMDDYCHDGCDSDSIDEMKPEQQPVEVNRLKQGTLSEKIRIEDTQKPHTTKHLSSNKHSGLNFSQAITQSQSPKNGITDSSKEIQSGYKTNQNAQSLQNMTKSQLLAYYQNAKTKNQYLTGRNTYMDKNGKISQRSVLLEKLLQDSNILQQQPKISQNNVQNQTETNQKQSSTLNHNQGNQQLYNQTNSTTYITQQQDGFQDLRTINSSLNLNRIAERGLMTKQMLNKLEQLPRVKTQMQQFNEIRDKIRLNMRIQQMQNSEHSKAIMQRNASQQDAMRMSASNKQIKLNQL
eukprot:403349503